jgi:hypothetical protein
MPANVTEVWLNSRYLVQVTHKACEWGLVKQLMICRTDRQPIRSWYDLQRIKNELCGEERVAIEVYPAESELVDDGHLYHLWVLPEGQTLPFALT